MPEKETDQTDSYEDDKEEEMQDVTTRIEVNTAEILSAKLEEVAKKVGEICN